MEFRLLGPVEVSVDGCPVDAGRPRQRVVLAALLVDAGRPVSAEVLIDRVWGDAPPPGARRTLHAHLSRIRRLLEQGGARPAPLVYRSGRYLLDIEAQAVDLHRFRRLVAAARRVGADDERARRLRDTLGLWRGEPLAGLAGEWAAGARRSWVQEHLDATMAWADAEVSIGNAAATIAPLTTLAGEHPLLEPLAAVLLRALHAAGRPAVALDHYAALRRRLADQLGTDPGAEVRAVHQVILRGGTDPASTPVAAGQEPPPRAARTLPVDVAGFVGRHDEMRQLLAAIDTAAASRVQTVTIHAVDGMAGIGKTTFAVHAAHHLAARYPDGQQFVDLRAHAPGQDPLDPADALATLLQADGIAAQQIPAGLDARANLWRERMADQKLLLVLDDAADTAHVAPLLPAAPGCLVLITSRRKLGTLPNATRLWLDTLSLPDAAQLFTHRAGPRADRDPAAVKRITRLCGYLPLAITLTAARLHTHSTWTVTDLADDLTRTRDRLNELASDDVAVAAAFDLSYRDLNSDRRRLFRRLALHPGPDFDAYAAAVLDGSTLRTARRGLETLLEHNLITEPHRGRYRFHDLIAEHARTHATTDPRPERDAALDRLLTYYQHTSTTAAIHQQPGFTRVAPVGDPPDEAPIIADQRQAGEWFTAELTNLAAATTCAAGRQHPAATAIPAALYEHLHARGPLDLALYLHRTALTVTQHTGDQPTQAHTLINLANMQRVAGDSRAAADSAERAHTLFQQLDDRHGQAAALIALARVRYSTDENPAAAAERALTLYQQVGDRHGQATALDLLARVLAATGDFRAAATAVERAYALHRQVGGERGQATALDLLARMRHAVGEHSAAAAATEEAYALHQRIGNHHGQATSLITLARIQHATGDNPAAIISAERALRLYRLLGDRYGQAIALNTLARVLHANADHPAAATVVEQARTACEQIGDRLGVANAKQIHGIVLHAVGDLPAAAASLDQALDLFRAVGDPDGEAETLNYIAQLFLGTAEPGEAQQRFTAALDIARRIGTPRHEARALEGIGECLIRQGHWDDGSRRLREAVAIYRRIRTPDAARVEATLVRELPHERRAPG